MDIVRCLQSLLKRLRNIKRNKNLEACKKFYSSKPATREESSVGFIYGGKARLWTRLSKYRQDKYDIFRASIIHSKTQKPSDLELMSTHHLQRPAQAQRRRSPGPPRGSGSAREAWPARRVGPNIQHRQEGARLENGEWASASSGKHIDNVSFQSLM
jgi:hypothetical protein